MSTLRTSTPSSPSLDLTGLWLCPPCGSVHAGPPCPPTDRPRSREGTTVAANVRLCACCARVPIPSGSPFDSFFCPECTARVTEVNRDLGRVAVPVCRDEDANLASAGPGEHAADGRSFLASQIELLEWSGLWRGLWLLERLRLPYDPMLLEDYLEAVVQLRHESFHAEAAFHHLIDVFHEYLVEIPSESPRLRAAVEAKALEFPRSMRPRDAQALRPRGMCFVREVAGEWARKAVESVQTLPACYGNKGWSARERLGKTVQALAVAAVRALESTYGPVRRPRAPEAPHDFRAVVLARPGEEWPEFLPQECPRTAQSVVTLEGIPAEPDMPICPYHLSMDRRHRLWVLWGPTVVEEGAMNFIDSAPVAWGPRARLPAADAAFLLLEASLRRDREVHGRDRPRPEFAMPGLLDEDLVEVLLDLVWEAET